jgi:hypothetical protein
MKPIRSWLVEAIYHDGYNVYLPKTDDGFMIYLEASLAKVPLVEITAQPYRDIGST